MIPRVMQQISVQTLDSEAQIKGFANYDEMCRLLCTFPINEKTKESFDRWREVDGTKSGMIELKRKLRIIDA